jgi:sirohydrochlorin ferrochelatase
MDTLDSGLVTGRVADAVVLLGHGSPDPAAQESTRALARALTLAQVRPVQIAYLRHVRPTLREVVRDLAAAGHRRATVVPLLLTTAHHACVDVPKELADCGDLPLSVTPALSGRTGGPDPRLVTVLSRRLTGLGIGFDAVVLSAAGSSDADVSASVAGVAATLASSLHVPCQAAFATRATPDPGEAVAILRRAGARRVVVVPYLFGPGQLLDKLTAAAMAAGAVGVCPPLGDAPELVELLVDHLLTAEELARIPQEA